MNNPPGVSPSKGNQGTTRGKEKIFWSLWESPPQLFFGMSRNAPLKETAAHNRRTFLSIVFVVWLRSVDQTDHITAKCEWRKLSHKRACGSLRCERWGISGFCFTPHARHQKRAVLEGYDHDGRKKNCEMKAPSASASCGHRYVQLMREYIFSGNV